MTGKGQYVDIAMFDAMVAMTDIVTKDITCKGGMPAFIAAPKTDQKVPCIVILHERYGLVQHTKDLARALQVVTEEVVVHVARGIAKAHPSRNLVMTGGVALNCVANGRLLREGPFDRIWIQPAAGDAGGALRRDDHEHQQADLLADRLAGEIGRAHV